MKKIVVIFVLLISGFSCTQKPKTNWNVTFEKKSKAPYGCYIAYHMLSSIFPESNMYDGQNFIKCIDEINYSTSTYSSKNNLIIVVTNEFNLTQTEFDKVQSYLGMDNYLLVLAENYSTPIFEYFNVVEDETETNIFTNSENQKEEISELSLRFNKVWTKYTFSGKPMNAWFTPKDSSTMQDLKSIAYARNSSLPTIIQENNFVLVRQPLTFTNYFLLQNNNKEYYEKLLAYFPKNISTVTWFSSKNISNQSNSDSDFEKLFSIPAIRYSFLIILALLAIYTLFESKRRQKLIPIVTPNTNDSLEFAETIGLLYYNKRDNNNLSEKMIQYYLEHLRSHYQLKTNELNTPFAKQLSYKINKPEEDTVAFISYLNYIRTSNDVTEKDIQHLYHQLKNFS